MPTCSWLTKDTTSWKPRRPSAVRPVRPRSESITRIRAGSHAEAHEVPIGHDHVARALRRVTDRQDRETSAVERMGRVGYFDLFRVRGRWVVEGGIMLLGRSTASRTPNS